MIGFLRLIQLDESRLALFPVSHDSETMMGTNWLIFILVWGAWIIVMGLLLLGNIDNQSTMSLANKGALLLIIAGILPTLGLYWSYRSLSRWQSVLATSQGYNILNQRLINFESQQEQKISRVVTEIQRFLEHPMWVKGDYTPEKIASLTHEINKDVVQSLEMPIRPNIVHRETGTVFLAAKYFGYANTLVEVNTIELIENLLVALQQTFARASGKQAISMGNVKATVLLDALQSLLGAANLYRLAMSTDRLDGHRLMGETLWSFLHLMRDEQRKVIMSFFITLERKGLQRRQIYSWNEEMRQSFNERPQEQVPLCGFGLNMQSDYII
ncbi:MAG TPA: hypothetical protein PKO06_25045, partial [Candidatus Ozemobacteraceae bacterium]|nr:hypothetical protein [Candidatus Ozemobacteraceae bacterium]